MTCKCPVDMKMKFGAYHDGPCLTKTHILANRVLDVAQLAGPGPIQEALRGIHSELMMMHFKEVA